MGEARVDRFAATRVFAVVTIALAGFLFSLTPFAERLDNALMDLEWSVLRKFAPRSVADEIMIVGVDEGTVRAISDPPGLWHKPFGRALERLAAARPRAIGLAVALPERSYDAFHPGLDRALFEGIVAARRNGPFVATLSIDPRTRSARVIHTPFLAGLGEEGLGIGLHSRDADGVTRHFAIAIPTEDGAFPTLVGRLCRALSRPCSDGLIDYSLGKPLQYVPLRNVLETYDAQRLEKLFRDRIVLIGDVQRFGDRVDVPVNLAGWEEGGGSSSAVVVHAQALRTALQGAPSEASRPLAVLLVGLAALLVLVSRWQLAAPTALLAAIIAFAGAVYALRAGTFVPLSAFVATLFLAAFFPPAFRVVARRLKP